MDKITNIGLARELLKVYDFDGFTSQEVWSRIAQKINIIIEHFNYLDKKFDNQKELVDSKLEYLLNEGLTEQVAKKIITLINDGTIGELINGTLLKEINDKVDTFKNEINEQLDTNIRKVSWILNVKEFLCDDGQYVQGDGVHDDTTGIQKAMDSIGINGGTVLFPSGVYKINDLIIRDKNKYRHIHLLGQNIENTRLFYYGSNTAIDGLGDSSNRKFFTIENISIINQSEIGETVGLKMGWNAGRCELKNVRINGFYHGILTYTNWNIDFYGLLIENNTRGFRAVEDNTFNALHFYGGFIRGNSEYNLKIHGRSHLFNGTDFSTGGDRGLWIHNAQGITLNSIYFENNGVTSGLFFSKSSAITLNGLTISAYRNEEGYGELVTINECNGFIINGYSTSSTSENIKGNNTGLKIISSTGVTLNGIKLTNLTNGINISTSIVSIDNPIFANVDTPFVFDNAQTTKIQMCCNSNDFINSNIAISSESLKQSNISFNDVNGKIYGNTLERPTYKLNGQLYFDRTKMRLLCAKDGFWIDTSTGEISSAS